MLHEQEIQEDSTVVLKMVAEYLITKTVLVDDTTRIPPLLVAFRMGDMRLTVHSGPPATLVRQLLVMRDIPFIIEN